MTTALPLYAQQLNRVEEETTAEDESRSISSPMRGLVRRDAAEIRDTLRVAQAAFEAGQLEWDEEDLAISSTDVADNAVPSSSPPLSSDDPMSIDGTDSSNQSVTTLYAPVFKQLSSLQKDHARLARENASLKKDKTKADEEVDKLRRKLLSRDRRNEFLAKRLQRWEREGKGLAGFE